MGLAALVYPPLLWLALQEGSLRLFAAGLAAVAITATLLVSRLGDSATTFGARVPPAARFLPVVLVALAAGGTNDDRVLKALPVLIQIGLLVLFASSLRRPYCLVSEMARGAHERFPDFLLPYCRRVTLLWTFVFAANAVVFLALAMVGSDNAWALYTGIGGYLVVATIGAIEYIQRKIRFRFYEESSPADRLWRRWFPAHGTEMGRRIERWRQTAATGAARESGG